MKKGNIKGLTLAAIALISLGAIILGGIAVVDQYGQATKIASGVTDETVTISSGTATTANDELSAFTTLRNESETFISGNLSIDDRVNVSLPSGTITTSLVDDSYNVTYNYLADSDTTTTAANFVTGLGIFGAFVAVLAISLIGKMIVGLFTKD